MRRPAIQALLLLLLATGCGEGSVQPSVEADPPAAPTDRPDSSITSSSSPATGHCADVIDVEVASTGSRSYRFDVTVASGDTGWDKYADAWEVRAPDGEVLGVRELLHPHVDEQPFTRSLSDVEIPEDVIEVTVGARDSVAGFCGETVTVGLG